MRINPCDECGYAIREKAENCANCGAPAPKKISLFVWIIVIFIILFLLFISFAPTGAK